MSSNNAVTSSVPDVLRYRGDQILLAQEDPFRLGPGAVVCLDLGGDGTFETEVATDETGLYTICLDAEHLVPQADIAFYFRSADGKQTSEEITLHAIREDPHNPACEIPVNCVPGEGFNPEPEICTCTFCPADETLIGSSLEAFTSSYTPVEQGVELATGKLRQKHKITSFDTRRLGFEFALHHASLVKYDGPWGQGFSHSFNMMIVQNGPHSGFVVTPDLRIYDISSKDGVNWFLPKGFLSRLSLDPKLCRWTMTHYSGFQVQFFQGATNKPGYPLSLCDPNGNTTRLRYNASGLLRTIESDLMQCQTLAYDERSRLCSFTDHIKRNWRFGYDDHNRLRRITTPITEYADIASQQEITEKDLASVLVQQPRTWTLSYEDQTFPSHVTAVTDQRHATPRAHVYDDQGRVETALINGKPVTFLYGCDYALDRLEQGNVVTRVIDREGNVSDHEIHGDAGGPIESRGRFGLRRKVTWTERGKGNTPLRDDEPAYWEQRWLHDCDCLSPLVVVEPFSSDDACALEFNSQGIPSNWPRRIYTYNHFRQATVDLYTDGVNAIRTQSSYQDLAFGLKGQYSRQLTWSDPRAFDQSPIYTGLSFEHSYHYDEHGNRTRHDAPTVTRGLDAPQKISETWSYNGFGQVLRQVDANGNVTVNSYFEGPSHGGDINTRGEFGGYLASRTVGADGSLDPVTNLQTNYRVNALGMRTRVIDPKGFPYDTEYNDLQEKRRWVEPKVTLGNGAQVCYETQWAYDGAGNRVLERRSNIDLNGIKPRNAFIDRSTCYDDTNNKISERVEVDAHDVNDLVTRFLRDGNDDIRIIEKPEGNREFRIYDERRLLFKTFYGVAAALRSDDGYPTDKRATALTDTDFVGLTVETYDARLNHTRHLDGRGNTTVRFFDFFNRQTAEVDPNSNGWVCAFDDASNVLTIEAGLLSQSDGQLQQRLVRMYGRFDEVGRQYQLVQDKSLERDQRQAIDPDDGKSSSYRAVHDPGDRRLSEIDANGNATQMTYDAADRMLSMTDALSNRRTNSYDLNDNLIRVEEIEQPGPGAEGRRETYVATMAYDELNRRTEEHILGLNGDSIDHAWFQHYDSRHNTALIVDAEGNATVITFDDADRRVRQQRLDGSPLCGTPMELQRLEWLYDRNTRVVARRAFADVALASSVQEMVTTYDDLDRETAIQYPDATAAGGSEADRLDISYDPNSNPIRIRDQRGVLSISDYDPGNRLVAQTMDLPPSVPGTRQLAFVFDPLNRISSARNDFARIDIEYDALSRPIAETQSIRLDGSGFTSGWEAPIRVTHAYDRRGNDTACQVLDGSRVDLSVTKRFDQLNRVDRVRAAYFDSADKQIASYTYLGPNRMQTKVLGNGAVLHRRYDSKRRVQSHNWRSGDTGLVGYSYLYDRVDNALSESFSDDGDRRDHVLYNKRYEVIGVEYRSTAATAPRNPRDRFFYDDIYNRRQASSSDPFSVLTANLDCYSTNGGNELTSLTRNGALLRPQYDAAGNATAQVAQPIIEGLRSDAVVTGMRWDAFNLLFDVDSGVTPKQHYRYDAFQRRIATLELADDSIEGASRRYIYCDWEVVTERLFDQGATLDAAPSTLERVYVHGRVIDEPLLTAIDRDGDRALGQCSGKNRPEAKADQEYYLLDNRLGSIMALLDAEEPTRILERYRYSVFGTALVQPGDAATGKPRSAPGDFGNVFLFTGRRFDAATGFYYYRNRYYDPSSGRFLSRDPKDLVSEWTNPYAYVANNPVNWQDPMGLEGRKAECVDCRLRVVYKGWQYFSFVTKWKHYTTSSTTDWIPAQIDKGLIQSLALKRIELQARVNTSNSPCCCSVDAEGTISAVKVMPDLSKREVNALEGLLAVAGFFLGDIVERQFPKAGPYALGAAIYIGVFSSIKYQLKRSAHVSSKKMTLDCKWRTMVADLNLGRVPTTRYVETSVKVNGETACQMRRFIEEY